MLIRFSFTEAGSCLNMKIGEKLRRERLASEGYTVERFAGKYNLKPMPSSVEKWIGARWGLDDFLFIGAAGIAIRYIAPWVRDKFTDSAVLVMDERANYVIPLLSGHMGGAVELARQISAYTGAETVITTATDVQGKFAVDVFAKENGLYLENREKAKRISAAVLEGRPVGFYSEIPVEGELPEGLKACKSEEELRQFPYGVLVARHTTPVKNQTGSFENFSDSSNDPADDSGILRLISRDIVVGIGCRRGVKREELKKKLQEVLEKNSLSEKQIFTFVSIDLKKDEAGILELAEEYGATFFTYPAETLAKTGVVSEASDFVQSVTGVDNVCERAAWCCAPKGTLIQGKQKLGGVTFALVRREGKIFF